jgi:hypothetical protein
MKIKLKDGIELPKCWGILEISFEDYNTLVNGGEIDVDSIPPMLAVENTVEEVSD